jgi:hypothetical protein
MNNFYAFGLQKAIFSLTTLIFGVTSYLTNGGIKYGLAIWIIWLVAASYDKYFEYLKRNHKPTPQFYNSKIPFLLSSLISLYFIYEMIMYLIK